MKKFVYDPDSEECQAEQKHSTITWFRDHLKSLFEVEKNQELLAIQKHIKEQSRKIFQFKPPFGSIPAETIKDVREAENELAQFIKTSPVLKHRIMHVYMHYESPTALVMQVRKSRDWNIEMWISRSLKELVWDLIPGFVAELVAPYTDMKIFVQYIGEGCLTIPFHYPDTEWYNHGIDLGRLRELCWKF